MQIDKLLTTVVATVSSMSVLCTSAQAIVTINAVESGGDVLFEGEGTLDLSALTLEIDELYGVSPFINAGVSTGVLRVGDPVTNPIENYVGAISGGGPFGTGRNSDGVGTGDIFGASTSFIGPAPAIEVPDGYVSGDLLAGTATFSGHTFVTLGLTPGTYVWSWGSVADGNNDSLVLNIGAVSVPESGQTILCMILGITAIVGVKKQL